jgi:hypothetical protein
MIKKFNKIKTLKTLEMFSNKLHLYLQIKFSRRDFSNYKIKLNISVKVLSVNTITESTESDLKYTTSGCL